MLRILIGDDHPLLRTGLRRILDDALAPCHVGEAGTAEEALREVRQSSWDLVILDVAMPGRSGLDALADLKALSPELPVLMLSMFSEEELAARALRAGASGYITKEKAPEGRARHAPQCLHPERPELERRRLRRGRRARRLHALRRAALAAHLRVLPGSFRRRSECPADGQAGVCQPSGERRGPRRLAGSLPRPAVTRPNPSDDQPQRAEREDADDAQVRVDPEGPCGLRGETW
jgi:DNA-binding NarL/FixJ family response regulator